MTMIMIDSDKLHEVLLETQDDSAYLHRRICESAKAVRHRAVEDDRLTWVAVPCPGCGAPVEFVDGASLRRLREAAGLSVQDLSASTRWSTEFLLDVEANFKQAGSTVLLEYLRLDTSATQEAGQC